MCQNVLKSVGYCLWGKQHYDTDSSSRNFETVCCAVWPSLGSPTLRISECFGVCMRTVQRIHTRKKVPIFITGNDELRKDRVAKLLNKIKHTNQLNILYFSSDEKKIGNKQMEYLQDNRWPFPPLQDEPRLIKTKHPVLVLWAVTSNGNFMPPFIFPHDLSLNMEADIK